MVVTIKVDEDLYQSYLNHNKVNPRLAMEQQLEKFKDHAPLDRVVVLSPELRKSLERLYGLPIEDQEKFGKWLLDALSVRVDSASVPLKKGQRKRLEGEAQHLNKPLPDHIKDRVQIALDSVFGPY